MSTITLTPSNITWLSQCGKRFDRLAVKKQYPEIKQTGTSAMAFSNACHKILFDLYNPQTPGNLPHTDQLKMFTKSAFQREQFYQDEEGRISDMKRAYKIIAGYIADDKDAAYTRGVELSGKFPIVFEGKPAFSLSARLDRIIVRPNNPETLVVRDYKMGKNLYALEPVQVFVMLCVAKLQYKLQYRKLELEVVNLTETGSQKQIYYSADLRGIHNHVVSLVKAFQSANDHAPTPSGYCEFCPLNAECQQSLPVATLDDLEMNE